MWRNNTTGQFTPVAAAPTPTLAPLLFQAPTVADSFVYQTYPPGVSAGPGNSFFDKPALAPQIAYQLTPDLSQTGTLPQPQPLQPYPVVFDPFGFLKFPAPRVPDLSVTGNLPQPQPLLPLPVRFDPFGFLKSPIPSNTPLMLQNIKKPGFDWGGLFSSAPPAASVIQHRPGQAVRSVQLPQSRSNTAQIAAVVGGVAALGLLAYLLTRD